MNYVLTYFLISTHLSPNLAIPPPASGFPASFEKLADLSVLDLSTHNVHSPLFLSVEAIVHYHSSSVLWGVTCPLYLLMVTAWPWKAMGVSDIRH